MLSYARAATRPTVGGSDKVGGYGKKCKVRTQRIKEQRLHKAHQRRTEGGLFMQLLDCTAAAAAEELRSSRRQQHSNSAAAAESALQARREERTRLAGVYGGLYRN